MDLARYLLGILLCIVMVFLLLITCAGILFATVGAILALIERYRKQPSPKEPKP